MNINVSVDGFVKALGWVARAADSGNDEQVATFCVPDTGRIKVASRSNTAFYSTELVASSIEGEPTNFALPMRIVRTLAGAITFNNKDDVLCLKIEKTKNGAKVNIATSESAYDFPTVLLSEVLDETPENTPLGVVGGEEFLSAINTLSKLVDSNANHLPALKSIDLKFVPADGKAVLMATDKFALCEIQVPVNFDDTCTEESQVLIVASELMGLKSKLAENETVHISTTPVGFAIRFDDNRFAAFNSVNTTPLNYKNIKETADKGTEYLIVSVPALKTAIDMVSKFSWESNTVHFSLKNNALQVTNFAKTATKTIPVEKTSVNGDKELWCFIGKVLQESLIPLPTNKALLRWGATLTHPVAIQAVDDDGKNVENVFSVAMPKV